MRRRTFVGLLALIAIAGCTDEDDAEEIPGNEEPEEGDPEPEPEDEGDDVI